MDFTILNRLQSQLRESNGKDAISVGNLELLKTYTLLIENDIWVHVTYIGKTHDVYIFQSEKLQYLIVKQYSHIFGIRKLG